MSDNKPTRPLGQKNQRLFESLGLWDAREAFALNPHHFVELALTCLLDPDARNEHGALLRAEDELEEAALTAADQMALDAILDAVESRGLESLSPANLVEVFAKPGYFFALTDLLDTLEEELEVALAAHMLEIRAEKPQPEAENSAANDAKQAPAAVDKAVEEAPNTGIAAIWAGLFGAPGRRALWAFAGVLVLLVFGWSSLIALLQSPESAAPAESAGTADDNEVPQAQEEVVAGAWNGTLLEVQSAAGGAGLRQAEGPWMSESASAPPLEAGAELVTDDLSRARLKLGTGSELVLDHGARVVLDKGSARSAEVVQGRAAFFILEDSRGPALLKTPHASIEVTAAKLSIQVSEQASYVSVASGAALLKDANGAELVVRPGEEGVVFSELPPQVYPQANLGAAMGWSAFDDAGIKAPRGLGKLVGKTAKGKELPAPLALEKHHVEVKIQGSIARTEITEVFRNDSDKTLEGTYTMPLPLDAQISRLALLVDGEIMEGEIVESERANKIWRGVLKNGQKPAKSRVNNDEIIWVPGNWRDPALLRWEKGDQFELKIFPIEPHSSRQVTIAYTQRLEASPGGRRYRYPLPVDVAGEQPVEHFSFKATVGGHDPKRGVLISGYPAQLEASPETSILRFQKEGFVAAGDLELRLHLKEERELRVTSYRDPHRPEEAGYVMMALRPHFERSLEAKSRDLVMILDRSYSMLGEAAIQQQRLAEQLVAELDPQDRVLVLACASTCEPLVRSEWAASRRLDRDALRVAIAAHAPAGASNLEEALLVATAALSSRSGEPTGEGHILYLGDGVPSAGSADLGQLRAIAAQSGARLTTVEIGANADSTLLEQLSQGGGGELITLDPSMGLMAQALQVLGSIYQPVLGQAALSLPAGIEQVHPSHLPSLYAGQEILVTARAKEAVLGELRLTGVVNGNPHERTLPLRVELSDYAGNAFVPSLWAEERIAELSTTGLEAREEIVALSIRHGVLSRYTAWLTLESEAMMNAFGIERVHRPVWSGEEASEDFLAGRDEDVNRIGEGAGKRSNRAKKVGAKTKSKAADTSGGSSSGLSIGAADSVGGVGVVDRRPSSRQGSYFKRKKVAYFKRAQKERYGKEIAAAQQALEAQPDARVHHRDLLLLLSRAGELDEALVASERWLQRDPFDTEALLLRSEIQARLGLNEQALESLESAADTAAPSPALNERVAKALQSQGKPRLACAQRRTLEEEPSENSCGLVSHLGWLSSFPQQPDWVPDTTKTRHHGGLVASLEWQGDAQLELSLIDKSGVSYGWYNQGRKLVLNHSEKQQAGVPHQELELVLPYLGRGTWYLEARRVDPRPCGQGEGQIESTG